jgi:hypothetical protein
MPARSPIGSVNDFVVRFANVNCSGSTSANKLFARSVLVLPRSTLVEERQTQMGTGDAHAPPRQPRSRRIWALWLMMQLLAAMVMLKANSPQDIAD